MASTTALRWAPVRLHFFLPQTISAYHRVLCSFTHTLQEHSGVPEVPSGSKSSIKSPLPERSAAAEHRWSGNHRSEYKGEAMHTIPEECERLFCDTLSTTFLGEGTGAEQESLGTGAFQSIQPSHFGLGYDRIQKWVEVWDYTGDAIYRGFVTDMNGERTLFVFFEDGALDHGLKSG